MKRLGRTTREGVSGVLVDLPSWDGERQREEWSGPLFFPSDQRGHECHPRHPTGYDEEGNRAACVSPSCSYYSELCRYAGFRFREAAE